MSEVVILTKTDLTELLSSLNFDSQKKWISAKEACVLLGIKDNTLRKWKCEGRLKFSKLSTNHILYDRKFIEDLIESKAENARIKQPTSIADGLRRRYGR